MRRPRGFFALVLGTGVALAAGCRPGIAGEGAAARGSGAGSPAVDFAAASEEPTPDGTTAPEPADVGEPAPADSLEVPDGPRFSHADTNPDNDGVVGPPEPLADCESRLEGVGIEFAAARIGLGKKKNGVYTCGAAQVVRYAKGPAGITYGNGKGTKSSRPLLTCSMALALADFETLVQEVATAELGRRVRKIDHLGTYNCREMALYDLVSEHSFANGIDFRRFHLEGGASVGVLEDFRPELPLRDASPETRFLRTLSNRLYDENVFSNVITPFFDRAHRNHIHCDVARYRVDGSRP